MTNRTFRLFAIMTIVAYCLTQQAIGGKNQSIKDLSENCIKRINDGEQINLVLVITNKDKKTNKNELEKTVSMRSSIQTHNKPFCLSLMLDTTCKKQHQKNIETLLIDTAESCNVSTSESHITHSTYVKPNQIPWITETILRNNDNLEVVFYEIKTIK